MKYGKGLFFMSILMDSPNLVDIKNGKKIDWQEMKRQSNQLAVIYRKISDKLRDRKKFALSEKYKKRSENVAQCNSSLLFGYESNKIDKKLVYCNNCRDRGCVLCNHKKSRVHAFQLNKILKKSKEKYNDLGFIFCTFTIRNIENDPDVLHETISQINRAFGRMMRYSRVIGKNGKEIDPENRIIKGSIKNVEVTYNEKTDTLHPHIHAIFVVDKELYFSKKYDNYIDHDEWVSLWRRALGVDYDPSVHVEKLHSNSKSMDDLSSAILELSKYETKPSAVLIGGIDLDKAMKVVYSMTEGLKNTRSFSFAGILKEIKNEIFGDRDLNDISDDEMINVDGQSELDLNNCQFVQYRWSSVDQDYIEVPVESDLISYIREKFGGKVVA